MTASVLILCLMLGGVRALVDLNCSDNATCIENLGRDLVKSIRERKAVRLFDTLTIEPLSRTQGRSGRGIWGMMEDHALSFDWGDYTFRISLPKDGRDDALDLELYESRAVKEEPDTSLKKSSSKVEDDKGEEQITPKRGIRRKRRAKKKVMQALIPLMFGMKSAGVVIFAFALVTILTLKAFMASKLALIVTIGMALKRLYESYSTGVGFQNHPYLYSQYPIDFPSASSHAYSVSGVSPQFASNEMYSPNMLGTNAQEFLQQQDASAQQSQQAPLLVNSTHAAERWDGKSKIRKFLEPLFDGFKTVINPIANIFYGAIPTFRGLNTEVSTEKEKETNTVEEVKKPKEFLLPQPRFFAQRKNFVKTRTRPKKHTELKIDLDKLKHNKDFIDYIKTKKYKYNYPNTFYYPRVKYVINPNLYYIKPNNSRLLPYRKVASPPLPTPLSSTTIISTPTAVSTLSAEASEWKPIVIFNTTTTQKPSPPLKLKSVNISSNFPYSINTKRIIRRYFRNRPNFQTKKRIKRDLSFPSNEDIHSDHQKSLVSTILQYISGFFSPKPQFESQIAENVEGDIKTTFNPKEHPPLYYSVMYDALMITLDVVEGLFSVHEFVYDYYLSDFYPKTKRKRKFKRKSKPSDSKVIETNELKVDTNNESNETGDKISTETVHGEQVNNDSNITEEEVTTPLAQTTTIETKSSDTTSV